MVRTATGAIALYMRVFKFVGWTSLWGVIYVLPGWEDTQWLLRHERKHLEQMQRDGKLWFMVKYALLTLRHGYYMNPYEVEARMAEVL